MGEERTFTEAEAHKWFAIELNKQVWTLLESKHRSRQDDDRMVWAAYASQYHWSVVGTPIHHARGCWLISRVHAVLGDGQAALAHAEKSLAACESHGFGDFDLAYAYEAMARAAATLQDLVAARHYLDLAREAGAAIGEPGDRDLFFADLKAPPWFDLTPS